jgi:diaminopimelate decarboxylase
VTSRDPTLAARSHVRHRRHVVDDIVERWGTPLYLYDLDVLDTSIDELRRALPAPHDLLYSVKANPSRIVLDAVAARGVGAEVSSAGELRRSLAAGFPASHIACTGPGKDTEFIELALAAGCAWLSVESLTELARTAELLGEAASTRLLVRLNLPEASLGAGLRMNTDGSKFGLDADSSVPALRSAPCRPVGVHVFGGSNIADDATLLDNLCRAAHAAAAMEQELGRLEAVDLGGGFPAPFAVEGAAPPLALREGLVAVLDAELPGWRSGRPRLIFESGRRIVGPCGVLVCRVTDVKESGGQVHVIVDSGIHHLGGMRTGGRLLPTAMDVVGSPRDGAGPAIVGGPLCTPLDSWGRAAKLSRARPGDVLMVPNVGAYGLTASVTGFLSHEWPVELGIRGDAVVAARQVRTTEVNL